MSGAERTASALNKVSDTFMTIYIKSDSGERFCSSKEAGVIALRLGRSYLRPVRINQLSISSFRDL